MAITLIYVKMVFMRTKYLYCFYYRVERRESRKKKINYFEFKTRNGIEMRGGGESRRLNNMLLKHSV